MREPPPPDLSYLTSAFFAIHILGGHVGLPVLVATFIFSKNLKRHPTIVNFCVMWIIYSIIYCLLLYGDSELQKTPPHFLCVVQSGMNYGAPPMAAVAGLAVMLEVWSTFFEPWKEAYATYIPRKVQLAGMILPPYLTFLAFSIPASYIGWTEPHLVAVKNGLYCGLTRGTFEQLAVPVFCGGILVFIIVLEVATVVRYIRGRHIIKKVFPLSQPKKQAITPLLRCSIFLLYSFLTLGVCITNISQNSNAFAYMIQAALPLAAFFVFGLQKDVICTWFRFHRRPSFDIEIRRPSVGFDGYDANRPPSFMSQNSHSTMDSTTPITPNLPRFRYDTWRNRSNEDVG